MINLNFYYSKYIAISIKYLKTDYDSVINKLNYFAGELKIKRSFFIRGILIVKNTFKLPQGQVGQGRHKFS